jgi:hypothetical protein
VWPVAVVARPVFGEDPSGVGFVHDQNMVECLPSDRADDSLAVGMHARCPGRPERHVHALGREDGVAGVGVLAVAGAEHEARRLDAVAEVGGQVAGPLGRPPRGGPGGDAGDAGRAGAVLEETPARAAACR